MRTCVIAKGRYQVDDESSPKGEVKELINVWNASYLFEVREGGSAVASASGAVTGKL